MSYRSKKSKRSIDPRWMIGGLFLLGICFIGFLFIRLLFGGSDDIATIESPDSELDEDESVAALILREDASDSRSEIAETVVYGLSGHQANGIAQRVMTFAEFRMTIVTSMPAIDNPTERYEAWLLQPGLAGYFSLGSLELRADGYYALAFDEPYLAIPADPETYSRLLITRETLADDGIPSNIRIAESLF